MSTKIYNGYILPKMTITELLEFCKQFNNTKDKTLHKYFMTYYWRWMIQSIDMIYLGVKDYQPNFYIDSNTDNLDVNVDKPIISSLHIFNQVLNKRCLSDYNDGGCPHYSIVLFPTEQNTLALMFDKSNNIITKAFEKLPQVKPFYYYDNCDKPNNISEQNWKARGLIWDQVLGGDGYGIPIDHGLIYEPKSSGYLVKHLDYGIKSLIKNSFNNNKKLFDILNRKQQIVYFCKNHSLEHINQQFGTSFTGVLQFTNYIFDKLDLQITFDYIYQMKWNEIKRGY